MFYIEIFWIAFLLSTLFSLWGIGFAVAFVPILSFLWFPFSEAKAIWLFLNSISTWTGAFRNWKKKVLDFKFGIFLTVSSFIWAIIWSYLSKYVPVHIVKILFAVFLVFSVLMLLWWKKKKEFKLENNEILISTIALIVWIISWLLWVWGGAIMVPLLVLIWFDAKYVSRNISFVIAISTFWWFLTYISYVKIDWIVLLVATIASFLWGWLWNHLMNEKLNTNHIKKILALLLLILAGKLIYWLI